jgi:preprotein translocase subunit SecD
VLVVMAFMLIYYRGSGINADLALILNLVILLGVLGFWKGARSPCQASPESF